MLKDITQKSSKQFKDLGKDDVFLMATMHEAILFKISDKQAVQIIESETNHGHSHDYGVDVIEVPPTTAVTPVEIIKIDVQMRRK